MGSSSCGKLMLVATVLLCKLATMLPTTKSAVSLLLSLLILLFIVEISILLRHLNVGVHQVAVLKHANDLPMCESNQTNRLENGNLSYEDLIKCLFFYCDAGFFSKGCTGDACSQIQMGSSSSLCIETTVEICSKFSPSYQLNASTLCYQHLTAYQSSIAVRASSQIFVGIKSSSISNQIRVPISLLTWMQALSRPNQVHIVTDIAQNDVWMNVADKLGIVVEGESGCASGHSRKALCCKVGTEGSLFFKALDAGIDYRWFCFFDDDIYVNVPNLVRRLQQYNPLKDKIYLGHYPDRWHPYKIGNRLNNPKFTIAGKRLKHRRVAYGLGAANCISVSLMKELESYLRNAEAFTNLCLTLSLPDDATMGILIDALGYNFTNVPYFLTHLENLKKYGRKKNLTNEELVTFGYRGGNHIYSSQLLLPQEMDPTRFLSYHCLIFPEVDWCKYLI